MNNSPADRRSPLGLFPGQLTPKLYDGAVEVLRTRHCSRRTEQAYLHWIHRFLLGHEDVKTTMVYTHVLNRGRLGVHSPPDRLRRPMSVETGRIRLTDRSA